MNHDMRIPPGWRSTTLGAIGRYLNGRAFKTSEWSKAGRPIIRIQDLTGSNRNPNYFEGDVEDRYVVRPGDLLISWSATLGAYIWDGPEAVLNQHIFKVESKIAKRFHYHLARERIAELERQAHGSGMVHVTKGTFEDMPVAIPDDLHLQRQIADLIDSAEYSRSSASHHLNAARRTLERFQGAVLAAGCAGGLTADWREQNLDTPTVAKALLKHLDARGPKKRDSTEAVALRLPSLPDTYVVSTVKDASLFIEYGTSQRCEATDDDVPVLRMGNIQDGRLDTRDLKYCATDDEIERLMLHDGDLLFNRTNSPELVGKSAVFHEAEPMTFASYLIRVRFPEQVAHPDYVNYWINSAWGRLWARHVKTDGVSQSNINGTKLGAMPLPLPPIEEQYEIVRRVSVLLTAADRLVQRIESASVRVDRSSQAVLVKAFRGGLAS